jgi:ferrochelatase
LSMSESSPYVRELEQACAAVAAGVGKAEWKLAYQSRSGPPSQPWLEPDIGDFLRETRSDVVVAPIGFLSDHMEVIYDLDTETQGIAGELGIRLVRAGTVETHPLMIEMIGEMVEAETGVCPVGCCTAPARRPVAPVAVRGTSQ